MEKEWKELCIEGLAIHGGPEPCVGVCEGVGGVVGRGTRRLGIEPRNRVTFEVPTSWERAEGNTVGGVFASRWGASRGRRTCACAESSCARTGRSHSYPSDDGWAGRAGKAEAVIP